VLYLLIATAWLTIITVIFGACRVAAQADTAEPITARVDADESERLRALRPARVVLIERDLRCAATVGPERQPGRVATAPRLRTRRRISPAGRASGLGPRR
jgi:hypothetical protein